MIALTRRYRFPAAHVLAQPAFSTETNRAIYGKCANPAGHGHDDDCRDQPRKGQRGVDQLIDDGAGVARELCGAHAQRATQQQRQRAGNGGYANRPAE